MKITLGIERWTIQPETIEEFLIMQDYMTRIPKVSAKWDEISDLKTTEIQVQDLPVKIAGLFGSPFLTLDFDPDENLEQT